MNVSLILITPNNYLHSEFYLVVLSGGFLVYAPPQLKALFCHIPALEVRLDERRFLSRIELVILPFFELKDQIYVLVGACAEKRILLLFDNI